MEVNQLCEASTAKCKTNLPLKQCTLLELSNDLKRMFEDKILADFVVYVNGNAIPCHRAILRARSKWFLTKIGQAASKKLDYVKIEERNATIANAVLLYIYTGNLKLIESLKIPFLELYDASDKYGLQKLRNVLTSVIKSKRISMLTKSIEFSWCLCTRMLNETSCPYLEGFSLDGTDKWRLILRPSLHSRAEVGSQKFKKPSHFIEIYLVRDTKKTGSRKMHITNLQVHVVDTLGIVRRSVINNHIFKSDGEHKVPDSISLNNLLQTPFNVVPNNTLTLSVQLTISVDELESSGSAPFELTADDAKHVTNELHSLSYDMYNIMKDEKYCDTSIHIKKCAIRRAHACVLQARSMIPIMQFPKLEDVFGFGEIVWRSFLAFLYTGQVRYLDDHVILLYRAASVLGFNRTRSKYSSILAGNLQLDNVAAVLSESIARQDLKLKEMTTEYIVANCTDIINHPSWRQFQLEFPNLSTQLLKYSKIKVAR